MASNELWKIRKDIKEWKKEKAIYQRMIERCEQNIARCQKSINNPSTDESKRKRLKGKVERYKGDIQWYKQEINRYDKAIIALGAKEGAILAISDVKNRDLFKEAMKKSCLEYPQLRITIFGYAGSGKSHVLALMLGEPPEIRTSTACAKKPVRTISHSRFGVDEKVLKRIGKEEYSQMMMKTARDGISKSKFLKFKGKLCKVVGYVPSEPTDKVEKDLIVQFHKLEASVESLEGQTVGEVTDSGGQPQFLEILPRFIDNLSLGILVTDLSQRLDECPMNYYYNSQGEPIGEGVRSLLTNEQILCRCMQMIVSQSQGGRHVRFVFVGTHRDLEHKCTESREEKNQKLIEMVKSFGLEDSVIYSNQQFNELIFALNAKEPEEADYQTAGVLIELMMDRSVAKIIRIPVNYHSVELTLKQKVRESNHIAFLESEILQDVAHFHLTKDTLKEALRYLHGIKLIFYFEKDFPGVVIGEPQAVLDKLTELVAYHIELTTNPKKQRALDEKWKKFSQCGILNIDCLEQFPGQYVEGVFSPADMMKLFENLLIVSEVNQGEYLMPCVLPVDPQTTECETQSVPPMVLHFTRGVPRHGVYCGTICHVMTEAKWKLLKDPTTGEPFHITRNSVHFSLPRDPVKITINDSLDSFFLITVHVSPEASYNAESISRMCTMIRNTLVEAIAEVTEKLNYTSDNPEVAFLCEKHKTTSLHPAVRSEYGSDLTCTKHHIKGGTLTDQHRVWLKGIASSTSTTPHSTSVHQTGVTSSHPPPPDSTPVHHIPSSSHIADYPSYVSSLPACAHPLLERQLDWDHGGVDRDLNTIADDMLDWETKLSTSLKLTATEIHDIKFLHPDPVLLRRAVLRKWKEKEGLHATYGNLLRVCCEGGDTSTAQVICHTLREKTKEEVPLHWIEEASEEEEVRNTPIKATENLNYSPEVCEQHEDLPLHPATVSKMGDELLCTKNNKGGTLTDRHRIWLKDAASSTPVPSLSTSVHQTGVTSPPPDSTPVHQAGVTSPHPPPPDSTPVHQAGVTSPHQALVTSPRPPPPDSTPVHHIPSSSYSYAPPQTASSKKATSHNLSTADHFKVSKVLKALDNEQLIHLGTALGLEYPHLKRMQTLPEDMIAAWLNMEDEVMNTSGIPTWSSLIKALQDTDQRGVASHIRKEQHTHQEGVAPHIKKESSGIGIIFDQETVLQKDITSKSVVLEDMGVRLFIPEDALSKTEEPLTLTIHPCFSGPFELPDDCESASPAYLIKHSRRVEFQKDITVEIHHYVCLESEGDCDDMVFLSASSTPEFRESGPVYVFKEIKGAKWVFKPGYQVGKIALRHFCIIKTCVKRTPKKPKAFYYSARLYRGLSQNFAVFCICLHNEVYTKHCDRVMEKGGKQWNLTAVPAKLTSEEATLCVADGRGWSIIFDKEPTTILRRDIHLPEELHLKISKCPDYPPRISLEFDPVQLDPTKERSNPIRLGVLGLDTELSFNIKVSSTYKLLSYPSRPPPSDSTSVVHQTEVILPHHPPPYSTPFHRTVVTSPSDSTPIHQTGVTSPRPPPPDSTPVHHIQSSSYSITSSTFIPPTQTGPRPPHVPQAGVTSPPPDSTPVHHIPSSSGDYAPPETTSASSKKATSHNLSTADHFKVVKVLKALDNEQLIHLGTALGLEYPHLKRMQTLPDDMVFAWLNMEDEVMDTSGIPTWSSLIKALEDTDQKGVASRIRKEVQNTPIKATENLNYSPEVCEQHEDLPLHPATVSKMGDELLCTKNNDKGGTLTDRHRIWLKDAASSTPVPSLSTSVHQTGVTSPHPPPPDSTPVHQAGVTSPHPPPPDSTPVHQAGVTSPHPPPPDSIPVHQTGVTSPHPPLPHNKPWYWSRKSLCIIASILMTLLLIFFMFGFFWMPDSAVFPTSSIKLSLKVRDTLIKAINDVTEKLNYTPDSPEVAFLCEQHKDLPLHPATVSKMGDELLCTKNNDKGGTVTDQHRVWLKETISASSKKATSHNLSTADHFKVAKILEDLNNVQLIRLGTALGLKYPHLQRMQTLPDDMVFAWLNMEDEVMDTSGIPTWSSLIKALEDTDQKGVASRIRKEQHSNHHK